MGKYKLKYTTVVEAIQYDGRPSLLPDNFLGELYTDVNTRMLRTEDSELHIGDFVVYDKGVFSIMSESQFYSMYIEFSEADYELERLNNQLNLIQNEYNDYRNDDSYYTFPSKMSFSNWLNEQYPEYKKYFYAE